MSGALDWAKLGAELRASALDAHDGQLPPVEMAYQFLDANPECFGFEIWPADFPAAPTLALFAAYYGFDDVTSVNDLACHMQAELPGVLWLDFWIAEAKPEDRDQPTDPRFNVTILSASAERVLYEGEDELIARATIKSAIAEPAKAIEGRL